MDINKIEIQSRVRHSSFGEGTVMQILDDAYVILFDDKTSLDLDGFTSIQFTEQEVLPLLSKKGINIKSAMSEKELPWYTE